MYKLNNVIPCLRPNDTVCVVAPGMASDPKNLAKIKEFIHSWGLKPHIPKDIFKKGYISANSLEKRFEFLKEALLADESKMVWYIRGGYGSHELLPLLSKLPVSPPKIFCGFSDATSLHIFLTQNWDWQTLHGMHLDKIVQGKVNKNQLSQLKKIIFGEIEKISFNQLKPLNRQAEKTTDIHGTVAGGNLITLQSHIGTPWELNSKGKILFFEDIGERAYRLKRVLVHLKQIGAFKEARSVVFGEFTGCLEPDGKNQVPKILKEFANEVNIPVFHKLPCGHGLNQWTLPLGTDAQIYKYKQKYVFNISTGISEV